MQKPHNAIFGLAERLRELRAEKVDAERVLREIKREIAEAEANLSEVMETNKDWLAVLVGVFKKAAAGEKIKGGGSDV